MVKLIILLSLCAPLVQAQVAFGTRPISVSGAVKTPITFQANRPVTLLDAIARAGGLVPSAGSVILVDQMRVSVQALIDGTNPEDNVRLSGGEQVRVPEARKVFVLGNVTRPGALAVRDGAWITVPWVLASADGLTPFAARRAYIYRRGASGRRSEMPIELSTQDTPLQADDILYVPDSRNRPLGLKALEKLLLFDGPSQATPQNSRTTNVMSSD